MIRLYVESGCKTFAYFFPNGVKNDEWEPAGSDFPWEIDRCDQQYPLLKIDIELSEDIAKWIKSKSQLLLMDCPDFFWSAGKVDF